MEKKKKKQTYSNFRELPLVGKKIKKITLGYWGDKYHYSYDPNLKTEDEDLNKGSVTGVCYNVVNVIDSNLTETYKNDESFTDMNALKIETEDGLVFYIYHDQDCCEDVHIADVNGDWNDLIGTEILVAEERSEEYKIVYEDVDDDEDEDDYYIGELLGYTFYTFRTRKGDFDLRFEGESNGYYGVDVDFLCYNDIERLGIGTKITSCDTGSYESKLFDLEYRLNRGRKQFFECKIFGN